MLVVVTAAALLLGALGTTWSLLLVPFTGVAAVGAWLGLSGEELFDAFGDAQGDDVGRGPAGLWL